MPTIKTTLKQLTGLFARSAANEALDKPVRNFAAQLTILTAHVERVDAKCDAETTERNAQIAELAGLIAALQSARPAASVPVAEVAETDAAVDGGEDVIDKIQQETAAEAAALAKESAKPPAAPNVTPLPVRTPNNGKKASSEEAS